MPLAATPSQSDFSFTKALLAWFDIHGRKNLPWQHPRTPYFVWISEVMLQQTQVKTVVPYFLKFIKRFPTLEALAKATEDEVLAHWSGLGYYSRGRNLQKTAYLITTIFNGVFPSDPKQLVTLPGIGDSTAAAIASLAFNQPAAIMDGNVKRILSRYFLIAGLPTNKVTKTTFLTHANTCLSNTRAADYTQAIMDLGALICTPKKPTCTMCPLQTHCLAHLKNLTNTYPEKAPKKTIPTRAEQFILIHNQARSAIYLEKRPSKGLWGGLWCLPSLDKDTCAVTHVQNTHALKTQTSVPLPVIKHTFTHFKLHLYPRALCVQNNILNQILPENGRWIDIKTLKTLGLAKPIQTIIEHFINMDDALPFEVI
ncbi:MAG: A/G-specific adenine glycosylase [Gammaproteobacteria bacterium]|nr:A/G-specific adenine glycosylase [Gammaproteobacteria bacterium]